MKGSFRSKAKADLLWVVFFFLVVLAIENFLVYLWGFTIAGEKIGSTGRTYSIQGVYSIAMLCSGSASFIAGFLGFLFGIPQTNSVVEWSRNEVGTARTDSDAGDNAGSQQAAVQIASETAAVAQRGAGRGSGLRRNTNLESISDALTKGILAIGASQLYKVGDWINDIGPALGDSFGPEPSGRIVALCVISYGAVEGFLFGYLATRIYLTSVFARDDPQS